MAVYTAIKDLGKTNGLGGMRSIQKLFATYSGGIIDENGFYAQNGSNFDEIDVEVGDAFILMYGPNSPVDDTLFHVWSDDTEVVVIEENNDPSGFDRIDAILIYVDIPVADDTVPNNPGAGKIIAVKGTPASSPTAPTQGEIEASVVAENPYLVIWTEAVENGFSSLPSPVDVRPWIEFSMGGSFIQYNQTLGRWEFYGGTPKTPEQVWHGYDYQTGITASTTQTQGQGALTKTLNVVSVCANANDTVTLPSVSTGMQVLVVNNGAQTLKIYPASGDDLGAGTNNSTTLAAGSNRRWVGISNSVWETDFA